MGAIDAIEAAMTDPLGVRCNNPGNIERSNPLINWRGLTGYDGVECVFATPQDGWHALCMDLLAAQLKHNRHTIAEIITPYAPPSENDTAAYIQSVCMQMQTTSDIALDLMQPVDLSRLAQAMAFQEQGAHYWPPSMIYAAASEAISIYQQKGAQQCANSASSSS
jgi:hypothetical protein